MSVWKKLNYPSHPIDTMNSRNKLKNCLNRMNNFNTFCALFLKNGVLLFNYFDQQINKMVWNSELEKYIKISRKATT